MRHANRDQSFEERERAGTTRHRWTDATPPASAVVESVARRARVDPTCLTPLYDAIDPDALNDLFRTRNGRVDRAQPRVTFRYADYEITVEHDGSITVSEGTESR